MWNSPCNHWAQKNACLVQHIDSQDVDGKVVALRCIGAESFGTNESYQAPKMPLNYSHVLFHIKVARSSKWSADAAFIKRLASCFHSYQQSECVELEWLMRDFVWSVHELVRSHIGPARLLRTWTEFVKQKQWRKMGGYGRNQHRRMRDALLLSDCNSMSFFLNTLFPCSWKLEKPKRKKPVILRNKKGRLFIHH